MYLSTAENSPDKSTIYSGFRKVCQRLQCPEISESGQFQHQTDDRVVGFGLFMRFDINNKNCEESFIIPWTQHIFKTESPICVDPQCFCCAGVQTETFPDNVASLTLFLFCLFFREKLKTNIQKSTCTVRCINISKVGLRFTCFSCCFTFFQIHTRLTITTMLKIECTVFCFFFWSTVILSLRQTAHPSGYRQHCTFSSPPLFVVPFGVFFFFFFQILGECAAIWL